MNSACPDLENLGWSDHFRYAFAAVQVEGCTPARVMLQERDLYTVMGTDGEFTAEVAGRFRHEALSPEDYPAVGDWVAVRLPEGEGRGAIHAETHVDAGLFELCRWAGA